jgi:hypothetical protein
MSRRLETCHPVGIGRSLTFAAWWTSFPGVRNGRATRHMEDSCSSTLSGTLRCSVRTRRSTPLSARGATESRERPPNRVFLSPLEIQATRPRRAFSANVPRESHDTACSANESEEPSRARASRSPRAKCACYRGFLCDSPRALDGPRTRSVAYVIPPSATASPPGVRWVRLVNAPRWRSGPWAWRAPAPMPNTAPDRVLPPLGRFCVDGSRSESVARNGLRG